MASPASEHCPRCAELRPPGTRYCERCGWDYASTPAAPDRCPKCGAERIDRRRFCRRCGYEVAPHDWRRRSWIWVMAAATAGVILVASVAWVAVAGDWFGGGAGDASPTSESRSVNPATDAGAGLEADLLSRVPQGIADCELDSRTFSAIAAIVCRDLEAVPNGYIRYQLFPDRSAMEQDWAGWVADRGFEHDRSKCAFGLDGEQGWSLKGTPSREEGRMLCYGNDDGSAWIEWTDTVDVGDAQWFIWAQLSDPALPFSSLHRRWVDSNLHIWP